LLFKLYGNIFTNQHFTENVTYILEDLYDNNEFLVFRLYFLVVKSNFTIDLNKTSKHLDQYNLEFIDLNIVLFYKNFGLVNCCYLFVWLSLCEINNLVKISSYIKDSVDNKICIINKNVNNDLANTIINFDNGIVPENEFLFLFICIDKNKK